MHLKSVTLKGFKSFAQPTTFALRDRGDVHRRTERLGQVERRRRPRLGDGRAGRQDAPRRQDGGRHLRRHRDARPARPRRGAAHDRQRRRRTADRVLRGDDQPHALPQRRERVRDQRRRLPAARRAGAAQRLRSRPRDARHRRPGPARQRAAGVPRGSPRIHRGGGRHPQAPAPQREDPPQARRDGGEPHAPERSRGRAAPPAQAARTPGRDRARSGDDRRRRPRRARRDCFADELVGLRAELAGHARSEQERHAERLVLQDQLDIAPRCASSSSRPQQRSEAVDEAPQRRFRSRARAGAASAVSSRSPVSGSRCSATTIGRRFLSPRHRLAGHDRRGPRRDRRDRERAGRCAGCRDRGGSRRHARARRTRCARRRHRRPRARSSRSTTCASPRCAASAEAAASALAAVRAAVERQQRALDAALAAARSRPRQTLAGIDPDLVPEGSAAEYAAAYERAQREATDAEAKWARLRERLHAAEREVEALTAQTAALGRALDVQATPPPSSSRAAGPASGDFSATASRSRPGYEAAIAAALGPLAEGVLVDTRDDAFAAARVVRRRRSRSRRHRDRRRRRNEPGVARDLDGHRSPARDVVIGAGGRARHPVARRRRRRPRRRPRRGRRSRAADRRPVTIVTRAGEVVTAHTVRAGSGQGRSRLELAAERDAAAERRDEIVVVADSLREALADGCAGARGRSRSARRRRCRRCATTTPRSPRTPSRSTAPPSATRRRSPSATVSPPASRRRPPPSRRPRAPRESPRTSSRCARGAPADPRRVGARGHARRARGRARRRDAGAARRRDAPRAHPRG